MMLFYEFKKSNFLWIMIPVALALGIANIFVVKNYFSTYKDNYAKETEIVMLCGNSEIDDSFIANYYKKILLPELNEIASADNKTFDYIISDVLSVESPDDYESIANAFGNFMNSYKYLNSSESFKKVADSSYLLISKFKDTIVDNKGSFYFIDETNTRFRNSFFTIKKIVFFEIILIQTILIALALKEEKQYKVLTIDYLFSCPKKGKIIFNKGLCTAIATLLCAIILAVPVTVFHCNYFDYGIFLKTKIEASFFFSDESVGFLPIFKKMTLESYFRLNIISVLFVSFFYLIISFICALISNYDKDTVICANLILIILTIISENLNGVWSILLPFGTIAMQDKFLFIPLQDVGTFANMPGCIISMILFVICSVAILRFFMKQKRVAL